MAPECRLCSPRAGWFRASRVQAKVPPEVSPGVRSRRDPRGATKRTAGCPTDTRGGSGQSGLPLLQPPSTPRGAGEAGPPDVPAPSSTRQRQAETGCPSLHGTPGSPTLQPEHHRCGVSPPLFCASFPNSSSGQAIRAGWRERPRSGTGKAEAKKVVSCPGRDRAVPTSGRQPPPSEDSFLPSQLLGEGIIRR